MSIKNFFKRIVCIIDGHKYIQAPVWWQTSSSHELPTAKKMNGIVCDRCGHIYALRVEDV